MKAVIIGAGVAGLAAAVRLAAKGCEVAVYEASEKPGGKLTEFEQDGYRFDLGPSLFTMPQYVDELLELAGNPPHIRFDYERLPVVCRYFWEDGTRLAAFAKEEDFAREVEGKLDVPAEKVLHALEDSAEKYELTGQTFLHRSLHKASTWLTPEVGKALLQLPHLDLLSTMNSVNERLLKHPKLVQLFNRFATYNGSDPYQAPGLLTIIPHFEHHFGAYFPKGGMYSITKTLVELGKHLGVEYHFGQRVSEIIVEQGTAKGIRIGQEQLEADRIICNSDVFFAYKHLLPNEKHPNRVLKQEKSTSALIFYWGINRSFPELDLHNILFSENYREEFAMLRAGKMSDDPTVYINISSKYCPGDAPQGHENWFVMVNAPYDRGQDWASVQSRIRQRAVEKINRILGVDLEAHITSEYILNPKGIEVQTGSHLGALYGTASNDRFAAFLRHANFSSQIKGLYFCGGSVHPGGGIPLCLLGAKIVDELIDAA